MNAGIAPLGTYGWPPRMPYGLNNSQKLTLLPAQLSGGVDPDTVNTMVAWYDFSDTASLTLNDRLIASIANKSGRLPTLSQTVADSQPQLGAINGRQAAMFDGVNDFLLSSGVLAPGAGTMFVVVGGSLAADKTAAQFCSNFGATVESFSVGTNSVTAQPGAAGRWSGTGGALASTTVNIASQGSYIVSATFDRFSSPVVRSSGQTSLMTSGLVSTGNQSGAIIGARQVNASYSSYWNSAIGEVLYYSSVLSSNQITAIERYLSIKWGSPA